MITADGIQTETVDPTSFGKITVINFWGTWCTPCVEELPYFDRIASEYKDEVSVVAIHSFMSQPTAPEYIGNYYPDSEMIFAGDLDADGYYKSLGGRGTYPYTVILDERGVITHVFLKSLDYEQLHAAVLENLE